MSKQKGITQILLFRLILLIQVLDVPVYWEKTMPSLSIPLGLFRDAYSIESNTVKAINDFFAISMLNYNLKQTMISRPQWLICRSIYQLLIEN